MRYREVAMSEQRADLATDEPADQPVDDWEIEEIISRYERSSEGGQTRAGGTTSCH
jgi:hypothetical protein